MQSALAAVQKLATEEQGRNGVDLAFGQDSERDCAKMAWTAWLGYYNGLQRKLGWSKDTLVETAAEYATVMGFTQVPTIPAKTIGKMGLKVIIIMILLLVLC